MTPRFLHVGPSTLRHVFLLGLTLSTPLLGRAAESPMPGSDPKPVTAGPIAVSFSLSGLEVRYDGAPKPITVVTMPANVPVRITYDGNAAAPVAAGWYDVVVTSDDPRFAGSTSATLVIRKANALVRLGGLTQVYDALPKTVTATTMPANLKVLVSCGTGAEDPIFPGRYSVAAAIDDPNYVGFTSGTLTVTITATVRHAPVLNGSLDGSLQVLTGEPVTLDPSAWISGDLLVPGFPTLQLNGLPMIAGTVDESGTPTAGRYAVSLNGSAVVRYLVRGIDPTPLRPVAMPADTTGTRDVTLGAPGDEAGDFATIRNLTIRGGAGMIRVPAGSYGQLAAADQTTLVLGRLGATEPDVYNLQSLTLAAPSRLRVLGPVVILLANGIQIGGSLGDAAHARWLTIAIARGGFELTRGASAGALVVAPEGTVALDEGALLTGEVMANRLTLAAGAELAEPAL